MFMGFIFPIAVKVIADILCRKLPVCVRKRQYFVSACFNCTGFMDTDMPGLGSDYSLVGMQNCIDDGCIGLCAAYEEKDCGVRCLTGRTNLISCRFRVRIRPVSGGLLQIGFH